MELVSLCLVHRSAPSHFILDFVLLKFHSKKVSPQKRISDSLHMELIIPMI